MLEMKFHHIINCDTNLISEREHGLCFSLNVMHITARKKMY